MSTDLHSAKPDSATQIVRKNFTDTVVSSLRTFGRAVDLAQESVTGTVADVARGHFQWRETLVQAWRLITVTAIPAILMAIPFGVIVSIQVGNLIHSLGADSMLGATGGLGVIKQGAPIATGFLLGGAGAAAIAADLGARTIREEIDALNTMGISPVHRLVIPRMMAMLIVAPMLNVLIIFVGVLAGYAVAVGGQGVTPGSYWSTFGSFATVADVWVSLLKALIFGFLVVVISCQRGLEAKGGPRGVADAVNAAVVLSVVSIAIVNLLATQISAMFLPTKLA
ncbi:MlaE family ABC transporter permease [Nocardia asteroides]|uniref:YrbE family protein n=1 Tax=Nocardia asteroides NBRC 15531 TaxID=1110697 RepID=U5E4G3_NOCAS|nr:ABC transporter permease [Nocardia asteroides]TLF62030.1 ABC transporter permease [Nocardia asteroides NBRC 15531]UGT47403.1 ABC transporter permease [Nocardia asteroides]SFN76788.1 phospholipid/cholesterol/gamma-HCH transport system permease protein [Nocardia asteroides]VEG33700.1 Probable phospholipid ABC transporter permease protein mlaE [Nocardia asteroides]GAD81515.1 YrbE family protein [Nocardia asteroides NBRC 15531]